MPHSFSAVSDSFKRTDSTRILLGTGMMIFFAVQEVSIALRYITNCAEVRFEAHLINTYLWLSHEQGESKSLRSRTDGSASQEQSTFLIPVKCL